MYLRSKRNFSFSVWIILLGILLPLIGVGQGGFDAGVTAGLSTSQISGDNLDGFNKFGIAGGGFTNYDLNEKVSAELQILFIQKGSHKAPNPEKSDYTEYLLNVNYIEVPILFQYHLDDLTIYGGPAFGTLVGSVKERNELGSIPQAGRPSFKDYELSVGAGMSYPLIDALHLDLRISNSVLPVRDHTGNSTFRLNRGQYHTVIAFLLRYQFLSSEKGE